MAPGKKFKIHAPGEEIQIVLESLKAEGYTGLAHIFRIPTAKDKIDYYRQYSSAELIGEGDARRIEPRIDYYGAINLLYDRCILKTEDYDFPKELKSWRDGVPLEHKVEAVELLLNKLGLPLRAQKVKN